MDTQEWMDLFEHVTDEYKKCAAIGVGALKAEIAWWRCAALGCLLIAVLT